MPIRHWVIVGPRSPRPRRVPIAGRLLVGRKCGGADPAQALILDDPRISRDHLELRAQPAHGATLVDLSTNGTKVNGRQVERGEPIFIEDGDRIQLGDIELELMLESGAPEPDLSFGATTQIFLTPVRSAFVVGDVVGYSRMTDAYGSTVVGPIVDAIFGDLRNALVRRGGTIRDFAGDAVFGSWDLEHNPDAATQALGFTREAQRLVAEHAARCDLRVDERPLRMGWGVTVGEAVASHPSPSHATMHSESVIAAFRLSGIAGRDDWAPILATSEVAAAVTGTATFGPGRDIAIRGRSTPLVVHAVE